MDKYRIGLLIAIFWTVAITVLSLISVDVSNIGVSIPIKNKDKIVHFLFYFVFVVLWLLALKNKNNKFLMLILFSAIVYGGIIELLQGLTPTRTADFLDFLANASGALFGVLIFSYALRRRVI